MPDTPEQIAADRIAKEAMPALCDSTACPRDFGLACMTCQDCAAHIGRRAVEAISAAGLVILPAARVAELMGRGGDA